MTTEQQLDEVKRRYREQIKALEKDDARFVSSSYLWLPGSLRETFQAISGVQPARTGQALRPLCEYCHRPNVNGSETCQGCGAPAKEREQE